MKMTNQCFDEIYKQVTPEQKRLLQEFRAAHPYKELIVNGICWRYISCGRGSKNLLLLPGALVGADMWFYTILSLERDYRIVAPAAPLEALTMKEVLPALVRIMEAEMVDRATVIGYSGGGGVAQYFIQEYPQKVERLVLSHCVPMSAKDAHSWQTLLRLFKILPFPLIRMLYMKRSANYPHRSAWREFARAYFRERISTIDKNSFINFLWLAVEAYRNFVLKPEVINSWHGEILILSSKDDEITIGKLEDLKARYPRARTHIFEQGDHHTVLLFPESYSAVLKKFLDGVSQHEEGVGKDG